jgi:hypothetical protein
VQERARRLWRALRSSNALVAAAATTALVSAVWGAYVGIGRMDEARSYYASLTPAERENEIELALGFDSPLWDEIRRAVRADDRYHVVSEALEQHEVRNYASYTLLPAIQVTDVEQATLVLYWANEPPAGSPCVELSPDVCVERREPS